MTKDIRTFIAQRSGIHSEAEPAPWGAHDYGHSGAQEPGTIVVFQGEKFDWGAVTEGGYIAAAPEWDSQPHQNVQAIVDAHNHLPTVLKMLEAVLDLCDAADETLAVKDIHNALEEVLTDGGSADA